MKAAQDVMLRALDEIVHSDVVKATVAETLVRVLQQLEASDGLMAWEVVPIAALGPGLPKGIRSCWIFVVRAAATTGAERHPNSHQRSFSLIGSGTFDVLDGANWCSHPLTSTDHDSVEQRWISIPPSTWHRLFVGSAAWGMLSFHTVAAEELIEETPVNTNDLDGETHLERYAGRR